MKIAVFTYDRYEKITTSEALEKEEIEHNVICHDENAFGKFVEAGKVNPARLLVSNASKGLANNRNWYLENILENGEWCLMLCDDFIKIARLSDYKEQKKEFLPIGTENTTYWSRKFRALISFREFIENCEETILESEKRGVVLAGFAGADNPVFRIKKWKTNILADGRAILIKKTNLRFDPNAQMVDDVAFSALNIANSNGVLVNTWVQPYFSRYTKGSYGSIAERLEQRRKECAYLVKKFDGLVKFGSKPGWPEGTHIRIQWMNPNSLAKWKTNQKKCLLSKIEKGKICQI